MRCLSERALAGCVRRVRCAPRRLRSANDGFKVHVICVLTDLLEEWLRFVMSAKATSNDQRDFLSAVVDVSGGCDAPPAPCAAHHTARSCAMGCRSTL